MSDDESMRLRLQQVAAYRELCRGVRRSGRHNVFFALFRLFLAYSTFQMQAAPGARLGAIIYMVLALLELSVGLYKSVFPSAEGVLLDGVVLVLFAAWVMARQVPALNGGAQPTTWLILLGLFMLSGSLGRFREYRNLRVLFAERPTPDQIAWFDDLVREIRAADPETDEQALDLPTKPHWRAKLLGTTAFFVAVKTESVLIAGPEDFAILPERKSRVGAQRVLLWIHDQECPPFEIDDASWDNYRKWSAAQAVRPPG